MTTPSTATETFNKVSIAVASCGITLVALRLSNQIDWAWRWTLAPIWMPVGYLFLYSFFRGFFGALNNTNDDGV